MRIEISPISNLESKKRRQNFAVYELFKLTVEKSKF